MKQHHQAGFTLVEMLVAVAISMVAMVALSELYASTKQAYRLQSIQSRLSEDGRFALSMLRRIVAQAGFRPDPKTTMPTNRITATSATSMNIRFTGDGTNTITCDGSVVASGTDTTLTIALSGSTLACTDTTDNTKSANWIAAVTGGQGTEVIDLRFGYGVDTSANSASSQYMCGTGDCVADSYTYGNTTSSVVSVRACFVLRSESADSAVVRNSSYLQCDNTTAITGSQTDHKLYRTFVTTVPLRNN